MQPPSYFSGWTDTHSGIVIIDMTRKQWRQLLFRELRPPLGARKLGKTYRGEAALGQLLDVAKQQLGASTAVMEPYISTDWNEEYGALYSRTFAETPRRAQRVHFFQSIDKPVERRDLFLMSERLKRAYLGFAVLRPLPAFRVGDSILASPCTGFTSNRDLVHCLARFETSLLGNRLAVTGTPFMQQDTSVGVCAEADLWMMARYLNRLGETRRYRPAEITRLGRRTRASGSAREGLDECQMADALRQMGLDPMCVYVTEAEEAKDFLFTCVESSLPVIAGLPDHVVLVIGHDYNDVLSFGSEDHSMSVAVSDFICHDDAGGPYIRVPPGSVTTQQLDGVKVEVPALGGEQMDFCIAPLPPRVNMTSDDVRTAVSVWQEEINAYVALSFDVSPVWPDEDCEQAVFRVYLRRSRDFKEDILERAAQPRRHTLVIGRYRAMPMPKYVWVVEIALRTDLNGKSPYNRRIRGEMLLDSTGNRHVPDETLLAFHYRGRLFIPERGGKDPELYVVKEGPYAPLLRATRQHES